MKGTQEKDALIKGLLKATTKEGSNKPLFWSVDEDATDNIETSYVASHKGNRVLVSYQKKQRELRIWVNRDVNLCYYKYDVGYKDLLNAIEAQIEATKQGHLDIFLNLLAKW